MPSEVAAWAWVAAAGLVVAACKPMSEKEQAYFAAREAERRELQAVQDAIADSSMDSEVLEMVKASPASEGEGTTEDWLQRKTTVPGGSVMFPEWTVSRRALNKFDVRFTFTMIDASNRISKSGYAWQVDTILKSVGPPREITPQEQPANQRRSSLPSRSRFREEDLNLE